MKIVVYSHDAYGLGNINRMLAICKHLLAAIPNLSILLISGSPMVQSFRMLKGLDYIKLPCLNRGEYGELAAKYLGTDIDETVKLRADLILSATANFKPDVIIVDKKPYGLKHELTQTLNYVRSHLLETKVVLLLRDILDSPEKTIQEWQKHSYYQAVEEFYDRVLIVGVPEIFDTAKEYEFPSAVTQKVEYCGYMRRPLGTKSKNSIREELQVLPQERLVLVTPGGGEDGYEVVNAYLSGLALLPTPYQFKSLIICGPEMPAAQRQQVELTAKAHPQVQVGEFTNDLMSYIQAADLVVSMAGYNTICEILSAGTPCIVIPRTKPSLEQSIRAEKMATLGLFKTIHPENIKPDNLMRSLLDRLTKAQQPSYQLNMNALGRVADNIFSLLSQSTCQRKLSELYKKTSSLKHLVQQQLIYS